MGLTLVEMLITMVGMVVIIGGLTMVFMSQSRMSVSEEELVDLQMNLRVATDRLSTLLSHAGFGSNDSFLQGKNLEGFSRPVSDIANNNSASDDTNPDSVIIISAFPLRDSKSPPGPVTIESIAGSTVSLSDKPSLAIGTAAFRNHLTFFPNFEGNSFFTIEGYDGNSEVGLDVDVEGITVEGASVFLVVPVEIQLVEYKLRFRNYAYTSSLHWEIAQNIEDMHFQYSLDGKTWWDQVDLSNLHQIQKIRFWLLGRSSKPVRDASSRQYELADLKENMGDPSKCVELVSKEEGEQCIFYRVGPFNDGHLRMLSRGEVVLRNAM